MNDKIRGLQARHGEKFARANELLSKAEPTDAERTEGLALIGELKSIKGQIETEVAVEDARGELDAHRKFREEPGANPLLAAKAKGSDGASLLGLSDAGKTTIDSFGSVLSEEGAGIFSEKRWDAMKAPEYRKAFGRLLRSKGNDRALPDWAWKAIQEGIDDQGGVAVPADMLNRIIMREPTPTRLAGMVTSLTTGRDKLTIPRTQYAADDLYSTAFRATWTGEIPSSDTAADVDDTNLFGTTDIEIFTAMLSASITNAMAEDSAFPIQAWVENQIRVLIDLLRDNMILNGTGIGQPSGLLRNPGGAGQPAVVKTGDANLVTVDGLVDLAYSVPEQYMDNCRYVLNLTNTARAIAKLKDGQNRLMFGSGYQDSGLADARPKSLLGYPLTLSGFMPNIGANAYPLIFGDLRGYYLVNRIGLTIQVLRETKAKRDQFELVARVRFGGKPVEPWRLKVQQVAA